MNLETLRTALENYHRKKWFPQTKPDTLEEWSDYSTDETIADLLAAYKQSGKRSLLSIAYYIHSTLPLRKHRALATEYAAAYADPLSEPRILPQFGFYYLRREPPETGASLWSSWKMWNEKWEQVLADWIQVHLDNAKKWEDLRSNFLKSLRIEMESWSDQFENRLRETQELFSWQLREQTLAQNIPDFLRDFRLLEFDTSADWNDFPALAKTMAGTGGIRQIPTLRKSLQNDALQFLFPILPPQKLLLEYGAAAGPVDPLRFLFEFGKGCFFAGMSPELPIEDRITGDPALSMFWGYLFSAALASKAGLNRYVNPGTEALAKPLRFWLQFWHRYDTALAIYRDRMERTSFSAVQEQYLSVFRSALPSAIDPPTFLYLYDLDRAENSFFRVYANSMAFLAEERLRLLYGHEWFASEACIRKFRDYWREGYRLSLKDVLDDLDVKEKFSYFLTLDS